MTSSCPCQLVVCRSAEAGALLGLTRKNIVIEFRWAESVEQLPEMAAELVRMKVDIIFASSSTYVEPARHATKTIPIVFAVHADPVGVGHVASLARPGGSMGRRCFSAPIRPGKSLRNTPTTSARSSSSYARCLIEGPPQLAASFIS
jgi:hypothetical protein